mgnify:CR=1 FL=1
MLESKTVVERPKLTVVECIVGDNTGIIVFSAKNEQGALRPRGGALAGAICCKRPGCCCLLAPKRPVRAVVDPGRVVGFLPQTRSAYTNGNYLARCFVLSAEACQTLAILGFAYLVLTAPLAQPPPTAAPPHAPPRPQLSW